MPLCERTLKDKHVFLQSLFECLRLATRPEPSCKTQTHRMSAATTTTAAATPSTTAATATAAAPTTTAAATSAATAAAAEATAAAVATAAAAPTTAAAATAATARVYVSTPFYGQRFGTNLLGQNVFRENVVATLYEQDFPSPRENSMAL